jgi:hypothetical protein
MRFCTAGLGGGKLAGGGSACERERVELADNQYGIRDAGDLWEFLEQRSLLDRLRQAPIAQKTQAYAPQAKLMEVLAGIMSGIEYLQSLNQGPRPLAKDATVARAWGLEGWAHYASFSRTLHACDAQTVTQVETSINGFSRPYKLGYLHLG